MKRGVLPRSAWLFAVLLIAAACSPEPASTPRASPAPEVQPLPEIYQKFYQRADFSSLNVVLDLSADCPVGSELLQTVVGERFLNAGLKVDSAQPFSLVIRVLCKSQARNVAPDEAVYLLVTKLKFRRDDRLSSRNYGKARRNLPPEPQRFVDALGTDVDRALDEYLQANRPPPMLEGEA